MASPLLFEINTRCWLRALSEKSRSAVTLATVPDEHVAVWQSLGFSHLWLMGVWTSGPRARAQALGDARQQQAYAEALPDWSVADVAGSPYAIASYEVPEALGGNAGLETFRQQLQSHGLKLLLDFVPNHLGLDHPWLFERPELFVQTSSQVPESFRQETRSGLRNIAHGKDPYFSAWPASAQQDYRRAETRSAMLGLLREIAGRCAGVRCDMAMLLLDDIFARTWARFPVSVAELETEFWTEAISAVKKEFGDFVFLAEAYWGTEARLRKLGFDFTYDKTLYDKLVGRDIVGVQKYLLSLSRDDLTVSAHFLENHDEPRIASLLSLPEQRAAALVVLGLPGMRFLHEGQLVGLRRRVPVQLTRRAAEAVEPQVKTMYHQLLAALKVSAVGQGAFELLSPRAAWPGNPTAQNFVLLQWTVSAPDFDLVVVNLAPHRSQCYVSLNLPNPPVLKWVMRDVLGIERFVRCELELQRQGLYLDVPAHGAQLFHFQPLADNPTKV